MTIYDHLGLSYLVKQPSKTQEIGKDTPWGFWDGTTSDQNSQTTSELKGHTINFTGIFSWIYNIFAAIFGLKKHEEPVDPSKDLHVEQVGNDSQINPNQELIEKIEAFFKESDSSSIELSCFDFFYYIAGAQNVDDCINEMNQPKNEIDCVRCLFGAKKPENKLKELKTSLQGFTNEQISKIINVLGYVDQIQFALKGRSFNFQNLEDWSGLNVIKKDQDGFELTNVIIFEKRKQQLKITITTTGDLSKDTPLKLEK